MYNGIPMCSKGTNLIWNNRPDSFKPDKIMYFLKICNVEGRSN